jgi:hypothetical protein
MVPRIDDAMILPEEFFTGILRNRAEAFVHVRDLSGVVGHGHNGGFVEGELDIRELFERVFQDIFDFTVLGLEELDLIHGFLYSSDFGRRVYFSL